MEFDPEKLLIEPLPTLTSPCSKPVTSLLNVIDMGMGEAFVGDDSEEEMKEILLEDNMYVDFFNPNSNRGYGIPLKFLRELHELISEKQNFFDETLDPDITLSEWDRIMEFVDEYDTKIVERSLPPRCCFRGSWRYLYNLRPVTRNSRRICCLSG